jgi:hypothetical protein
MTDALAKPSDVVCPSARLHGDDARLQLRQKGQQPMTSNAPSHDNAAYRIQTRNATNVLSKIYT